MSNIHTGSGAVSYEAIRSAMNGEPFTMTLTDTDEIKAVISAVNGGIDAHLEACFCPERGDRFEGGTRKAGRFVLCRTLDCHVSPTSLPVLLRRLSESEFGGDTKIQLAGMQLAGDILYVLGVNEFGEFVGREET